MSHISVNFPSDLRLQLAQKNGALLVPLPLTGKNAGGTVAPIYAEVCKRRAITQLIIDTCIRR